MANNAHALVFGASGLNGWAVVNQLLFNYPERGVFSRVTALTNRPLRFEDSYWPKAGDGTPELVLASGINVAEGTKDDIAGLLTEKVPQIGSVTHVFYFVHKSSNIDLKDEAKINVKMLERTIGAMDLLARGLRFVVYPGGAMGYGMYAPGGTYPSPLHEDLPRVSPPLGDTIPYYGMRDALDRLKQGKSWTWSEIVMDAIIGFAPNGSGWSLAGHWAKFLSCYRLVEGEGARVPFPGTLKAYDALFNETSSRMVAKCAIWASLSPEHSGRQLFNIADRAEPGRMRERWPAIAKWFGLEGVEPEKDADSMLKPSEYTNQHRDVLEAKGFRDELCLMPGWIDSFGYACDFDRYLSLEKIRRAGFTKGRDPNESWYEAFEGFRQAGLIPT